MLVLAFVPIDQKIPLWTDVIEPEMYKMQDDLTEEMDKYIKCYHDNYIHKIAWNGRVSKPLLIHESDWNYHEQYSYIQHFGKAWDVPPLMGSGMRMG